MRNAGLEEAQAGIKIARRNSFGWLSKTGEGLEETLDKHYVGQDIK